MKRRICSVRCDNCASISGTVSGIGSGTRPGSTPDEDARVAGFAGFDGLSMFAGFGEGFVFAAAFVVVTGATGSCEYSGNVKSKWCSGDVVLNFSFAAISAGNASLPTLASRKRPFCTGTSGNDAPFFVITRPDINRT